MSFRRVWSSWEGSDSTPGEREYRGPHRSGSGWIFVPESTPVRLDPAVQAATEEAARKALRALPPTIAEAIAIEILG